MTRRVFLSSAALLAASALADAKPPAKVAKVVGPPLYTLADLAPAEGVDRVLLRADGAVLFSTDAVAATTAATHLWSKGKLLALPVNFVGLGFGNTPGSVLGYVRTDTGTTRAALWKLVGGVRELLPPEDAENTRAVAQSTTGTVLLVLSSGDCGTLAPGAKEASETGRAGGGDTAGDPFRPVTFSATGDVIVGNQGSRAYRYDTGDWQELVGPLEDADETVVTALDSAGRLVCGYAATGSPAVRHAWVGDLKARGDDGESTITFTLLTASLPGTTATAVSTAGVVGFTSAEATPETGTRAVLWRGGKTIDLTSRLAPAFVGWTVTEARAINNAGGIVALATHQGKSRLVLLTPRP